MLPLYSAFIEREPKACIVLDELGTVLDANSLFEAIVGRQKTGFVGRAFVVR